MIKELKAALGHRRSYYSIGNESKISDKEIRDIVDFAVTNVPSAFNSQSARLVLLLGGHHGKFWDIVKETLRKMVPAEAFAATEKKINGSFASGYGTVLFFEDLNVVKELQESFPGYKDNFPTWSQHTSAMHQYAVWTMLESAGFGASLQHYNPLVDAQVKQAWNLPGSWELIAQMPFGLPTGEPGEKQFKPLEDRVKVFK